MSASALYRVCLPVQNLELAVSLMVDPSSRMVHCILVIFLSFLVRFSYLTLNKYILSISGFAQVVRHPWFDNFDWENLANIEGPLLPSGAKDFPRVIEYLKTCPKTDPNFKQLVAFATQNFDTFEDQGSALDSGGKWSRLFMF